MSKIFKPYLNQVYSELKEECIRNGCLFEDKTFPANETSLGRFNTPDAKIIWKRPPEFCYKTPEFIVNDIQPNDIDQGQIGDCWLTSAISTVATVPEYINIVVPNDQTFNKDDYAGIFRFRFWRFGEWIEVVVDDRLPVNARTNQLIYCHNNVDFQEMFAPLLEKAYAKLNLCYEFLNGGDEVDALIDMTGGVHERFKIKKPNRVGSSLKQLKDDFINYVSKEKLWNIIFKSYGMKSLFGASIEIKGNKDVEHVEENGLALGHAYSILSIVELVKENKIYSRARLPNESIESNIKTVKLLNLRNPWGQNKSWNGAWSSKSKEWDKVSDELKAELNFKNQIDGQFFISFDDFYEEFDTIDFVHVDLNAFYSETSENSHSIVWKNQQFYGAWVKNKTAGGAGNENYAEFGKNPQYLVDLKLENNQDEKVSIILSLMQMENVRKRLETNGEYADSNEPMNVSLFKLKNSASSSNETSNSNVHFRLDVLEEVFSNHIYLIQREITRRLDLLPGKYVIIPSLFAKNVEMKFLLRVFIEGTLESDIIELDKKKNFRNDFNNDYVPSKQELMLENYSFENVETKNEHNDYYNTLVNREFDYEEQEENFQSENYKTTEWNREERAEKASFGGLDERGKVKSRACSLM